MGASFGPETSGRTLLHELRTPLAVLGMLAEGLPEAERDLHQQTLRHVEAVLRNMTPPSSTRQAPEPALDVLGSAVRMVTLLNPEREVRIEGGTSRQIPRHPVEEIVVNLLNNALRHAPAGTPILVHIEELPTETVICVDDLGEGVAEADREAVFGYGYSTEDSSGIGLSVSRELAEQIGGRLAIPPSAKGCRVALTLPAPGHIEQSSC